MSKFTVFDTQFKSKKNLIAALVAAGWSEDKIEQGEDLALYGYHGDKRKETAEIVIRRKHLTSASNDLGFKLDKEKGSYSAIISDYDQHAIAGGKFLQTVKQEYAHATVTQDAKRNGFSAVTSKQADGTIRVMLQRVTS